MMFVLILPLTEQQAAYMWPVKLNISLHIPQSEGNPVLLSIKSHVLSEVIVLSAIVQGDLELQKHIYLTG